MAGYTDAGLTTATVGNSAPQQIMPTTEGPSVTVCSASGPAAAHVPVQHSMAAQSAREGESQFMARNPIYVEPADGQLDIDSARFAPSDARPAQTGAAKGVYMPTPVAGSSSPWNAPSHAATSKANAAGAAEYEQPDLPGPSKEGELPADRSGKEASAAAPAQAKHSSSKAPSEVPIMHGGPEHHLTEPQRPAQHAQRGLLHPAISANEHQSLASVLAPAAIPRTMGPRRCLAEQVRQRMQRASKASQDPVPEEASCAISTPELSAELQGKIRPIVPDPPRPEAAQRQVNTAAVKKQSCDMTVSRTIASLALQAKQGALVRSAALGQASTAVGQSAAAVAKAKKTSKQAMALAARADAAAFCCMLPSVAAAAAPAAPGQQADVQAPDQVPNVPGHRLQNKGGTKLSKEAPKQRRIPDNNLHRDVASAHSVGKGRLPRDIANLDTAEPADQEEADERATSWQDVEDGMEVTSALVAKPAPVHAPKPALAPAPTPVPAPEPTVVPSLAFMPAPAVLPVPAVVPAPAVVRAPAPVPARKRGRTAAQNMVPSRKSARVAGRTARGAGQP